MQWPNSGVEEMRKILFTSALAFAVLVTISAPLMLIVWLSIGFSHLFGAF